MTSSASLKARWPEFFEYYLSIGACLLPVNGRTKLPLVSWGTEASADPDVWRGWLEQFSYLGDHLGFAMVTGAPSGIVVLDLDVKHGAVDALVEAAAKAAGSPPPETLAVQSGGGGRHLFFRYDPQHPLKNHTALIVPGIDVRGDGGYIILPPTLHASGTTYEFVNTAEMAPSDWLVGLVNTTRRAPSSASRTVPAAASTERTFTLVQLASQEATANWYEQAQQAERQQVRAALNAISADCDYKTWINVGFALDASGIPDGRELWLGWSATAAARFPGRSAAEKVWDGSIGGKSRTREGQPIVTAATLFHLAKTAGWVAGVADVGQDAPPMIQLTSGGAKRSLDSVAMEAAAALCDQPQVYVFQDSFVEAVQAARRTYLHPLSDAALTRELCHAAVWVAETKKGGKTRLDGPAPRLVSIVQTLARHAGSIPNARQVRQLTQAPFMLPSAEVFEGPGYEASTKTLVAPHTVTLRLPTAEELRDPKQVATACYRSLFAHFDQVPFATDDHRAAFVALLLTLISRPLLADAPTPIFIINANISGAGKTRLAQSAVMIASGEIPPLTTLPFKEEEVAKRILAEAVAATDFIIFDNVRSVLGGASLESAITSGEITGRMLGATEMRRASLRVTWIATGNNCEVTPDMVARAIEIYLDAPDAEPRQTRFRVSEADWWDSYLPQYRSEMLSNLLGILLAHAAAGSPTLPRSMGSFGGWANRIAAAVWFASGCNPVDTQQRLREMSDGETEHLRGLLSAWPKQYTVTAADLMRLADSGGFEGLPFSEKELRPLQSALEPFICNGSRPRTINGFSRCIANFVNRSVLLGDGSTARLTAVKDNSGTRKFSVERITADVL